MINFFMNAVCFTRQIFVRWVLAVGAPIFVAKYTFLCVFNINGIAPSADFTWITFLAVNIWLLGFLILIMSLIILWLGRQISMMLA